MRKSIQSVLISFFVLLCGFSQAQAPATKKTPPPDDSAAAALRARVVNRFAGTWKLVSYTQKTEDATVLYPFGKNPIGQAMFDPNGRMSVQIMQIPHAVFTSGYARASAEEVKAVYEAYLAYYGTWSVDEMSEELEEHIEASNQLQFANRLQSSPYFFENNQLTIRSTYELRGRLLSTAIVWEKMP